jgi:hypothetical protein
VKHLGRILVLLGIAVAVVPPPCSGGQRLRYDTEYESIGYSTAAPTDPVARLRTRLENGETVLPFEPPNGYLAGLLRELAIPVSSQILVFTKTSLQKGRISPATPRAIYFSDDAYVAWVQDSPVLEISAVDPDLGAVFYTLRQEESPRPALQRETFLCLQCHDSYSLTGGGVPRHIIGSGIADPTGRLVSHEGWYLTDDRTPLAKRWGGWYVTGKTSNQPHMGNVVAKNAVAAAELDFTSPTELADLEGRIDTRPYLAKHSDVVALVTIEHQIRVQNSITRASWDTRTALHQAEKRGPPSAGELAAIAGLAEPLVQALLFADEAEIAGPVEGSSGFAVEFEAKGPRDDEGRSLRRFDLKRRQFRYPVSYLIYSASFRALPEVTKRYVARRLTEELAGSPNADRRAAHEILEATMPELVDRTPP